MALACCTCVAQTESTGHFDVASVKPSLTKSLGRFSSDPERITYESTTLENLIRDAYGLEGYQVSGPGWLATEWYTVTAKQPPGTALAEFRQMMTNLLVERFGLVSHRLMKNFDGYEITVAKGGPKLTASGAGDGERAGFRGSADGNGTTRYKLTATSMAVLTNRLSIMMRMPAPVVDRTGITGKFDFDLNVVTGNDPADISDALERQLGLKLNQVKVPLEVLVIDHARRVPAAN
jgi:uncharacterized protein (TIGR03435 family)